ncbi:DUF4190 domain-containing protein [Kitasatospora sp. NPDC049258]|uniref:DUF4190 domain-containing protein n=1 Tax=Kitasatospora sp. NPDC049258 TaxID=3155394 RepID=UPI0034320CC3
MNDPSAIFAQPSEVLDGSPAPEGDPAIPSDQHQHQPSGSDSDSDSDSDTAAGPAAEDALLKAFAPPAPTADAPPPPAPQQQPFPQPYPYPYPGWAAQPPGGWSGFAITSLVLGIIGVACCLWAGAIGFGIAALRTIPVRNQRGRGMAVAGLVLGCLWGLLVIAGATVAALNRSEDGGVRRPDSQAFRPGTVSVDQLHPGDCFARPKDLDRATKLAVLPCSAAHYGEVFATAELPGGDYPGERKVADEAEKLCSAGREQYTMDTLAVPDDVDVFSSYPQKAGWTWADDHGVTCVYTVAGAERTGSLRRDAGNLTAEQLTYLKAVRAFNAAEDHSPDEEEPADDPAAFQAWAKELADGADAELAALEAGTWNSRARQPVAELAAAVREEAAHLRAAAAAADPVVIDRELVAARRGAVALKAMAVRSALGLATVFDGHGSGGAGTGGAGSGSGPAPVGYRG